MMNLSFGQWLVSLMGIEACNGNASPDATTPNRCPLNAAFEHRGEGGAQAVTMGRLRGAVFDLKSLARCP
jgi:hypothetical protein